MECLDDRTIQAWLGGGMPDAEADLVRTHLDSCESCSDLIATVVQTRWVGQKVGRYTILELLGGGAMGEVYRATDPDLGRDVAIKVVRPGGSQKRLLREAQAMAQLAHPHVIRIYDVGTIGDDVFIAMELVQGRTLRAWFAEPRAWSAVVATLRSAGTGLAAAHEAKLVHGDFKPDNVLVADDGRVLVTDFGLVRTDEAIDGAAKLGVLATNVGIAGTPAYMAPEQFESGAATTASDQFAFCVSLYEALYGKRPFAGTDIPSLRASIAEKIEFPAGAPTKITRAIRRGLSVAPADRFATMTALLAELETSNRRVWIAAGAVTLAAAIGATAFIATRGPEPCSDGDAQLAGIWDAPARAKVKAVFEATKLPYAATSLATVSTLLDAYRSKWLATYTDTCKATNVRKEQSAALLDTRMTCMHRRREDAKAVLAQLTAGSVRDAVSAVSSLRPISDCEDIQSLQEIEGLPAEPAKREQIAKLDAENARCRALLTAGQARPAHECAAAAAKAAHAVAYEPTIAEAELIAGTAATRLRTWPEAEAELERSLLAAEAGRDARGRARALIYLVSVAAERSTFGDGHKRDDHATAVIKGLGNEGDLAAELAYHRGNLLLREGKLDDAEKALTQASELREKLFGADDARVAEPLGILAVIYITRRQHDKARALLERVLKTQEKVLGPSHPNTGRTLHSVAQLEARAGKLEAALAAQKRSYDILVAAYGEEHRDVAQSVGMAAQALMLAGKYGEALPFAERSVALMEKIVPDSPDLAVSLQTLAASYTRANKLDAALATHQRALAIQMKTLGEKHVQTMASMINVAMALRTDGRCEEALPLLASVVATRIELFGPEHVEVARALHSQGDCLVDLNRGAEAVPGLERALAIRQAEPIVTNDDKVGLAMAKYALARALWAAGGDKVRATKLARENYAELTALKDKRAEGTKLWATKHGVKLDVTPSR